MQFQKLFLCLSLVFTTPYLVYSIDDINLPLSNLPFEVPAIQEPQFADFKVNIREFGAISDGEYINTEVFAEAINYCSERGGGFVIVPRGLWLTGPIELKNDINLHLESGAVIIFSTNIDHYSLIRSSWEGQEEVRYKSPIFGKDLKNIAITGDGVIDGSGERWRPVKRFKLTPSQWQQLVSSGGVVDENDVWWPSADAMNGANTIARLKANKIKDLKEFETASEYLRPVMINFVNCRNILLDGPTFQNSPAWNIHPLMCENIIIRNINVRNPWYSQNGDGLDLESCKNVVVYNSRFDVGDDAICLKSGKNEFGRKRGKPSENIVIDNCIVYHGHGGFTVGSEMSGGIRNIMVRNCTFLGTDIGLRFKSTRGRGGVVENIFIENINMMDIPMEAIRFNMFYENRAPIPEDGEEGLIAYDERPAVPVSDETPQFRNIKIRNVHCRNAGQAVLLMGLPEMALQDMLLDGIFMTAEHGLVCVDAREITIKNIRIKTESTPVMAFYNSVNILVKDIAFNGEDSPFISVNGMKSDQIEFQQVKGLLNDKSVQMGREVAEGAIVWN